MGCRPCGPRYVYGDGRGDRSPVGGDVKSLIVFKISSPNRMTQMVRNHVRAAGLGNIGSCHLFRHAMARQMPENGADVRFIQAMLGHADIKTTQVYTRVSIGALKDIHSAMHPARLGRTAQNRIDPEDEGPTAVDLLAAFDEQAASEVGDDL